MSIKPGKYVHFKGNAYEVVGTALHSETQEELVVYRALYGGELWARPAAMWSETVDYDGRRVKRFTHMDDVVPDPEPGPQPSAGVHKHSSPAEKIELFLSLFAGRDDVFAKRFENAKKGIVGYIPVCDNEWSPVCPKTDGGKMKCRVNPLVLVHRTNLLSQWIARLNEFPVINEEPPAEFTPKGRKRKKGVIGQIGGGKNNLSGIIDIAVMQSLVSGDEVKELVKNYGMVIVDECHHVAAFSFEQILKTVNAKYIYGLTATPTRQDGHHPIIMMHCGPIRYKVDAKGQAEAQPFEHYIIPGFTRFQKPVHQDETKWTITDVYRDVQNSEIRNELIVQDVISAVEQGRNPIILTERTAHVKILTGKLRSRVKNVVSMTGGVGQKKSRELFQSIAEIPAGEPLVPVATGKYVGEGFDLPRLDTLFLVMPISRTGTVRQYADRLHQLFDGKSEVQIYDYADVHVAMPEKMYQKRMKSYASMGYKAKGTPHPMEDTHSIFDSGSFFPVYSSDILAARNEVLIVSPFLSKHRVLPALHHLSAANARVTVVTKSPDNYAEKDSVKIQGCIELLTQHGIAVKTRNRIHRKFAAADQRIVWYSSINLLSYGFSEESIMRIESMEIAAELMGTV